ncbi:cadherin-like domain-containing protein [Pseudomonas sp. C1C7]|uniref:Ig-like domain-containing protein n=1 Tax=Pseudomonas sp. C1C7 TaxID=2735272 RepID=UPI001586D985|nr:Ig-like domain-containing protein [Pseudomonas sp. C1C7]NUT77910.1 cadherin-like domain-containing protein [Pseudomonas sp. C1C7]
MNKWPRFIFNTLSLSVAMAGGAHAALQSFDPGPYTLSTGRFPMWYQDFNNVKLELCLSKTTSSRAPGTPDAPGYMCTIPAEGGFNPAEPIVFPNNWPGESFWFTADASVGDRTFGIEQYVAALEAVAGEGEIIDGEQHNFARIRIRAAVPAAGMYTVRHPYGTKVYVVATPGRRAINDTSDIGIAPLNYSGALQGAIGPYLYSASAPNSLTNEAGTEIARYFTETNPETGLQEKFVGDPNIAEQVRGSPVLDDQGNPQNYIEISGPAGTLRTNLFSISGKIYDDRTQTPVEVERVTYQRDSNGSLVEIFADSFRTNSTTQAVTPAASTVCYRTTLTLTGTPPGPCLPGANLLTDNNGYFHTHFATAGAPPSVVVLTASELGGANKATSVSRTPVDVVKVSTARYDPTNHRLTITATSSDKVVNPGLVAQGYGPLPVSGTLVVNDVAQPPESVTVKSAAGGSDSEPVTVAGIVDVPGDNEKPLAVADTASTSSGVPITLNVLANDSDPDNNTPLTIGSFVPPAAGQGTVALNGTTNLTYTPPATNVPLQATFSYIALDNKGLASDPATVTVNVSPNLPPVANNDTAATQGGTLTLNVLLNDADPEGNAPLSVIILSQPAAGQGTVSTDGSVVTYTAPQNFTSAFTTTFTYQVRDSLGALSAPATVTVQVTPQVTQENLVVTTAEARSRSNNRYTWDLSGTTSAVVGNTITVQVSTASGLVTLGTATVPVTGRWRLSATTTTIVPSANNPTVTIRSSLGTVRTAPLVVQ